MTPSRAEPGPTGIAERLLACPQIGFVDIQLCQQLPYYVITDLPVPTLAECVEAAQRIRAFIQNR